jgi:ABC-2 type transport system permease protein
MYTLLYSYPFGKRAYLLAKFGAAFLVVSLVVGMIGFGFALGTQMPGVKTAALLPFDIMAYVQLYLVFVLPNMLIFGTLVFATVAFSRNIYIGFISVILLIMIQGILSSIFAGGAFQFLGSLFDPMGETAVKNTIRYWTLEDRNQLAIPMSAEILGNRIFWLSLTFLVFILIDRKFQFSQFSSQFTKKNKSDTAVKSPFYSKVEKIELPKFSTNYSWQKQLQTTWNISNYDFRHIVFSWPFLAILLAGLIMVLFQQSQMNPQNGIAQLTTTATMLRVPLFIFTGIINLLTFLYAGVLIYRSKINRMDGLIDIVPQPNWVLAGAKLIAILKVQLL